LSCLFFGGAEVKRHVEVIEGLPVTAPELNIYQFDSENIGQVDLVGGSIYFWMLFGFRVVHL